jgi:hypothetical protein
LNDKVVDLDTFRPKRKELVLECKCGSQLFYLHFREKGLTGAIECRLCGEIPLDKCWGYAQRDDID